jgi:predicted HTH domain antitoxin/predicted RNase H-like HicB family nuclease
MTKTMSIRMDRENYDFLTEISKEERSDLSKAVRDLVMRGRVLLAVERYKKGDASLGKAAQLAGLSVGQMMTLLAEFGVESRIEKDDYLAGLKNRERMVAGCRLSVFSHWPMKIEYTVQIWSEEEQFVAHAMPLDVMSSGRTPEEARAALDEAVHVFLVAAVDEGSLEEILYEAGYERQGGEWINPSLVATEKHSTAVPA